MGEQEMGGGAAMQDMQKRVREKMAKLVETIAEHKKNKVQYGLVKV
jgi:hypothetical protein